MRNLFKILHLGFLSLILAACVASPGSESTGEFLDSSTTTTKVKATLVNDLGTTGLSIQVKTFKDQVQLSGFVPTERLKQRAGAIAAGVDGVSSVINDIVVKP
ncbi:BON domain-containing protein [Legionella lytica]|uniref:BON domain-containing protein n=1 Tax=Legionella lytica TaxID=96232 RepID=A0ABY4YAT5_9GAMM|nr:BON domain-containing protein [Legionella lytica]USQ14725.1 BON domain-containing protein [Legionella lytica]